jgi:hypothetical protein
MKMKIIQLFQKPLILIFFVILLASCEKGDLPSKDSTEGYIKFKVNGVLTTVNINYYFTNRQQANSVIEYGLEAFQAGSVKNPDGTFPTLDFGIFSRKPIAEKSYNQLTDNDVSIEVNYSPNEKKLYYSYVSDDFQITISKLTNTKVEGKIKGGLLHNINDQSDFVNISDGEFSLPVYENK